METAPPPVIDADGHVVMEGADGWLDYFNRKDAAEMEERILANRRHWYAREGLDPEAVYARIRERNHSEGGWDPHARLRDMDAEGIRTAVLFGTELGLNADAYAASVCRGYNDWLADYCRADPQRLRGVALLPLEDPAAAVAELERTVRDYGFVGFFMKNSVGGRTCADEHFHPVYAAAEALDVPLLLHIPHGLKGILEDQFGYDFVRSHVVHPLFEMLSVLDAMMTGLLDRLPRLRIAFLEGEVGWLPWFVSRMDGQYAEYAGRPGMDLALSCDPSRYLDEGRLFFSCDPDERYLAFAVNAQLAGHTRGEDCIVWASDYPHSDALFPGAVAALTGREDLSAEQKAKLTSRNAARLFGWAD